MTALLTAAAVWLFLMLLALAICADSKRRDIDAARQRHPSTRPADDAWSPDTEAAIEQNVGLVDDGAALVAETEAFLKWSADA